jgi:hypothetical protein
MSIMRLSESMNAMESGIRVFFIQKESFRSSG